jgi:hypothetical protein
VNSPARLHEHGCTRRRLSRDLTAQACDDRKLNGKFVPWLYAIAATIRQVDLREMASNASSMASGVVASGKLFNSPVLCMNFDPTLWAEAAGCTTDWDNYPPSIAAGGSPDPNPDSVRDSARVTTLITAIERVKGTMPQHPLACAITGPATIAKFLELDQPASRMDQFTVGELISEYVNVLCENKIDNVVIVEDPQIDDDALAPWVEGKHYSRIAKLANHYAVQTTLVCPQASLNDEQTREFDSLTYVIARADKTIEAGLRHAIKGLSVEGFGTGGVALPSGIDALETGSYFLTTPTDLDPESDFTNIQKDIATISSFLEGQGLH